MRSVVFRTVAYIAWALAFGLSVWLAVEFHDYTFGISLGVAVLALILSAFGLMLARYCAQEKDRLAMTIGIVLWAAGALSFAITELGYWSSSYKDRHAEYVGTKSVKSRQEGLKDLAWQAVRTGEARATVAELEARQKAAKQNAFWASSAECTKATAANSRAFCQSYFELEAKIASTRNIEVMEKRFENEKPNAKGSIVHNVFAGAELLSENTTLSEKEAATVVVLIIAMVLMLGRDLLLIVANPYGGATGASGVAKFSPATEASASPAQTPYARAPRADYKPWVELPDLSAKPAPEDPTPPPADSAPPVEPKPEPKPIIGPVLVDENWQAPAKPKGKPSKLAKFADIDAPTKAWLDTGRAIPVALGLGSSGPDIWDAYNDYCLAQMPPIKPLNPSHLGRSLRRVGVASAKTSRGVRYALKLIKQPVCRAA